MKPLDDVYADTRENDLRFGDFGDFIRRARHRPERAPVVAGGVAAVVTSDRRPSATRRDRARRCVPTHRRYRPRRPPARSVGMADRRHTGDLERVPRRDLTACRTTTASHRRDQIRRPEFGVDIRGRAVATADAGSGHGDRQLHTSVLPRVPTRRNSPASTALLDVDGRPGRLPGFRDQTDLSRIRRIRLLVGDRRDRCVSGGLHRDEHVAGRERHPARAAGQHIPRDPRRRGDRAGDRHTEPRRNRGGCHRPRPRPARLAC